MSTDLHAGPCSERIHLGEKKFKNSLAVAVCILLRLWMSLKSKLAPASPRSSRFILRSSYLFLVWISWPWRVHRWSSCTRSKIHAMNSKNLSLQLSCAPPVWTEMVFQEINCSANIEMWFMLRVEKSSGCFIASGRFLSWKGDLLQVLIHYWRLLSELHFGHCRWLTGNQTIHKHIWITISDLQICRQKRLLTRKRLGR